MTLVRDMMPSLRYGDTGTGKVAHIIDGRPEFRSWHWAYCSQIVKERDQKVLSRSQIPVCKRCLKITEKYA